MTTAQARGTKLVVRWRHEKIDLEPKLWNHAPMGWVARAGGCKVIMPDDVGVSKETHLLETFHRMKAFDAPLEQACP